MWIFFFLLVKHLQLNWPVCIAQRDEDNYLRRVHFALILIEDARETIWYLSEMAAWIA